MRIEPFRFVALIALAAASLSAQPYFSTKPVECPGVGGPVTVVDATGAKLGFSCFVSGTFIWYAAGGPWSTALRVPAPETGAIGIDYTFYDTNGAKISMDTTYTGSTTITSGNELQFYVTANQSTEINLLGSTQSAPDYTTTATGTATAVFYCPDAATCSNVLPQLVYSALPTSPWSLSAPIVWDTAPVTNAWTAEGIDDGGQHHLSFVIYNQGRQSADFVMKVYDSQGNLFGSATTKSIPNVPLLASGFYGEGGTYGDDVANVMKKGLPSGVFKVVIDGGPSIPCAVQILQFNGPSATTVEVTNAGPVASGDRPLGVWNTRVSATPIHVFQAMPQP